MWDILSAYKFAFLFISFLFTFSHMHIREQHMHIVHLCFFLLFSFLTVFFISSPFLVILLSYFFSSPLFLFSFFYSYNKLTFPNFLSTPVSPTSSFCFHSFSISSSVSYLHISMKTYSPFGY